MLAPITIRYDVRPRRRSLATAAVSDLFGLADAEPPHVVAEKVALDVRPGDVVLFVGPSGSGKSSLLRAAGRQLGAVDAGSLELPDLPLADALPGPLEERLDRLAACGLSEARLLLRTPAELSDGQRYRFRLAYAARLVVSSSPTSSAPSSTAHSPRCSRSTSASWPAAPASVSSWPRRTTTSSTTSIPTSSSAATATGPSTSNAAT